MYVSFVKEINPKMLSCNRPLVYRWKVGKLVSENVTGLPNAKLVVNTHIYVYVCV